MHYFIDGYNLMFYLKYKQKKLKEQRQEMISRLSRAITFLHLNVSIVFDGNAEEGPSHAFFNELEVIFTSKKETADEFILNALRVSGRSNQETVITSDKELARQARSLLAFTETIDKFIAWLNRSYKSKLKQQKQASIRSQTDLQVSTLKTGAKLKEERNYYEHIFEARFEQLLNEEQAKASPNPNPKLPTKIIRKKKAVSAPKCQKDQMTDMERWLKAFEEGLDT